MSILYILLAPLSFFVLQKKVLLVVADVKAKNGSKLKADVLFLILTLTIIAFLIWLIEFA